MFNTPQDAITFTLAGKAKITLTSKKSGKWFTYKVEQVHDKETGEAQDRYFVSVLTGPDNWANYTYLGMLKGDRTFSATKGSKIGTDSPSYQAFDFYAKTVLQGNHFPTTLEVRHEGRCGKCGRLLTVPESLDRGIGPECWANGGFI